MLVVDKPAGWSSARVVGRIKHLLGSRKVGHAGTLDPFATGVLVCLVGHATRLARFFLSGAKRYDAILRLGIETDTQDATGTILRRSAVARLRRQQVAELLAQFEGNSKQVPPAYSALKHQGVPLYKLARQGRPVRKPARAVHIAELHLRALDWPMLHLDVACSAGTYIRTLCADIGTKLGCGGHLQALRRTQSSGFNLGDALPWDRVEALGQKGALDALVVSPAAALCQMPVLLADAVTQAKVLRGCPLQRHDFIVSDPADAPLPDGTAGQPYKVLNQNRDLLAVVGYDPATKGFHYYCVFPDAIVGAGS